MDIHEYQAKEILARHGVPVPRGQVAFSPEQATLRARELGGSSWVVKAQVHTGGRGQAGGVKFCHSEREIADVAEAMFGRRLVTKQSQPSGKIINRVHVEVGCDIERELYFGLIVDRATQCVMVIASAQGGMEIEEVVERDPDAIVRMAVEPAVGFCDFQARELAFALGLPNEVLARTTQVFRGAYRAFRDLDMSMLEINPLVITTDGNVLALDAKMSFDDNALFRHPEIADLRDRSQEDPRESHAADRGLAYVGLDGDIGCVINGAGLAMATLDMIQLAGGEPANFLDIGGGASPERVMKAFRAVLADDQVRVILVNIFAGINRCDWVAQGIVEAFAALKIEVPVVVRLAGTNVEEGQRIITESGLPLHAAASLAEAAQLAVNIARVRAA